LALAAVLLTGQNEDPALHALENTYHLKIDVLRAPLEWKGDHYVVRADPPTDKQVAAYEPTFNKEWSLYPASYVQKAEVHRIVFGVDLSMNGQIRAAVPAFDGDTMYYDPALGSYNNHYQRLVIHHEFFHMVDRRMDRLSRDAEWAKLNAPGFRYGSGGAAMRGSGVGDLTDKVTGFVTRYGTSAVEEDKAELFAHMVVDGGYIKDRIAVDPILAAKVALLRRRLSNFDPSMGDEFWNRIPGWTSSEGRRDR
jgi:hypothetical protein